MSARVTRAMVLAAGLGLRMRPLTDTHPKPLIEVAGHTMLDRALDRLVDAGVTDCVVNTHHLGAKIHDHLAHRAAPRIAFSDEATPLETGGGVACALHRLGDEPFFIVNADVVWLDGRRSALRRLAEAWDETRMDALLLVHPTVRALGYDGRGDFVIDPLGLARRRRETEVSPYVFTGVELAHPRLFAGAPKGAFSLNLLFDRAAAARRLHALVHDGEWFHVGTPEALAEAEAAMREPFRVDPRRDS
jgi:N-acetyl-alpha-D-muramate 1-phosphate uridylyltransferase